MLEDARKQIGFSDERESQAADKEKTERKQKLQQLGATFDRFAIHGAQAKADTLHAEEQVRAINRSGAEAAAIASYTAMTTSADIDDKTRADDNGIDFSDIFDNAQAQSNVSAFDDDFARVDIREDEYFDDDEYGM